MSGSKTTRHPLSYVVVTRQGQTGVATHTGQPYTVPAYRPAEPFLREYKRRPTVKQDGIVAWLGDEIAWLESVDRTERGNGALSAYKRTLMEITDAG